MLPTTTRRIAILLLFVIAGANAKADESCRDQPVWTIRAGAIFLERSRPDGSLLSFELGGPPPSLNADDFNFDFRPGVEMDVIRHDVFDTDADLEVRYFEVDGWNSATPAAPAAFPVFNYATPFFIAPPGSAIAGMYQSELQSVEVNLRKHVRDNIQLMVGLRHVQLDEEGVALIETIPGGPVVAATGATNNLIGGQLGADLLLISRQRWSLEGLVKAGIYNNSAKNNTTVTVGGVPLVAGSSAGANEAAFLGELGVTGLYQLTDCLSLRATYQILWTNGIASASEQIAVSDPLAGTADINNTDSPFYHGAFVGLQFER